MAAKKSAARGRPPKVKGRKEGSIRIRVTDEQKRVLTEAAEKVGLDVSAWLRSLGVERARELGVEVHQGAAAKAVGPA